MGQYVEPDDVPVIGPDPYPPEDKQQAITYAEAKLEGDVNGGESLDSPEDIHEFAVNAYASFILAAGPEDPSDVQSGDFADEGEDVSRFANQLHSMYQSARSTILTADADEGEGTSPIQFGGTR